MKEENREKWTLRLYRLGNWVVRITGSLIFLYLIWHAFRYTHYMTPFGDEKPLCVPDSRSRNLLGLLAAVCATAVLMYFEKKADRRLQRILCRVTLAAAMLWIAVAGLWWISSSAHVPEGDQAFIYGGASYFIEGRYFFLEKRGYFSIYPFQLGLTALCELVFRVVGAYNYKALEIICVAFAVGSVYMGHRIVWQITESTAAVIGYNILMMGCLPLILYTSWVYGDIPSIFFALLAAWMLIEYTSKKKKRYLVVLAFALIFAMLVRKNSLILLVAICLASVLYALRHRDVKVFLTLALAAVCAYGLYQGIYRMYEIRSGVEHYDGIPAVAWVTMGMTAEEDCEMYGWYNNYTKDLFLALEGDSELTASVAKQDLENKLKAFRNDPAFAGHFFKEKILSQWNEPLYQAVFFNAERPEDDGGPEPGSLAEKVGGDYFVSVLAVCDRWQFIVYVGMLLYFLLAVKRDSNILQHVLAITLIGGFFFSMIHEAKARYIFPYYVMMFPFAVYGYRQAVRQAGILLKGGFRERKAADMREDREAA